MKTVGIVIPIMNESGNVSRLVERIRAVFRQESMKDYECSILFVDDGSTDDTLSVVRAEAAAGKDVTYISLSRNFGHQNALKAGLDHAEGDCVISMDGDLQHPPELIPELVKAWEQGAQIVNTLRDDKNTSLFKKSTSLLFYRLINHLGGVHIEKGSADFRLMDRTVAEVLRNFTETPLFFRGLIPWLGFKTKNLHYSPDTRTWGTTKYTFKKMASFAIEGITSFSIKPLRLSIYLGALVSLFSFFYAAWAIYIRLFTAKAIEGWTSLIVIFSLMSGLQLILLGIFGEYLGKIFLAVKSRPHYIVREHNLD